LIEELKNMNELILELLHVHLIKLGELATCEMLVEEDAHE